MTRLALIGYGLLAALIVYSWAAALPQVSSSLPGAYLRDFLGVYVGERILVSGQGQQLYDLALQRQTLDAVVAPFRDIPFFLYVYPAYVALIFAPLGALSYLDAANVMLGLNLLLTALILYGLSRVLAGQRREGIAFIFAAMGFVPLTRLLWQGQLSLWPLLGLIGALLDLRNGRERRAGAWLWLGLIKPQLIVIPLLMLIIERRWKTLATFAAGAVVVLVVSWLAVGNWLPSYLHFLLGSGGEAGMPTDMVNLMQNWRGLVYSVFGAEGAPATGSYVALILLTLLIVFFVGRRREEPGQSAGRLALATLLGLLIVPHLYAHDLVLALLGGAYLWRASGLALSALPEARTARKLRLLRWLLALGPLVMFGGQFLPAAYGQIFPWYMLLLLPVLLPLWQRVETAEANGAQSRPQPVLASGALADRVRSALV